jgi:hypothetical protein
MPFSDGAQSAAAKAKNNFFVGKFLPTQKKPQVLTFLPQLPPPAKKPLKMPSTARLRSSHRDVTTSPTACQEIMSVF